MLARNTTMHVLRIYHAGRDYAQRARERELHACGVRLTLAVPSGWTGEVGDSTISGEDFEIVELPVKRSGDVNRHAYEREELSRLIRRVRPTLLDVHEEPFSVVSHQCVRAAPLDLPMTMYTAQNVDKRFPPPFSRYEGSAHRRVAALYPCSRQAASVSRGKGFGGLIEVIPLGYDESTFVPGSQSAGDSEIVLGFLGRLVPEKGVIDAVQILERLNDRRLVRLVIVGAGPEAPRALEVADALGLADRVEILPWQSGPELASTYRRCHVVVVPSQSTLTWVEQFGRVIVEAQASGAVVAAYASGSIAEVARGTALLADVGEVDRLAERIWDLLESPSEFAAARAAGLELARERTWKRVATRQIDLYESVVGEPARRSPVPRSPVARRKIAREEFGPPAATLAGQRPFAVPLLRRGGVFASMSARLIDTGAELGAHLLRRGEP